MQFLILLAPIVFLPILTTHILNDRSYDIAKLLAGTIKTEQVYARALVYEDKVIKSVTSEDCERENLQPLKISDLSDYYDLTYPTAINLDKDWYYKDDLVWNDNETFTIEKRIPTNMVEAYQKNKLNKDLRFINNIVCNLDADVNYSICTRIIDISNTDRVECVIP